MTQLQDELAVSHGFLGSHLAFVNLLAWLMSLDLGALLFRNDVISGTFLALQCVCATLPKLNNL
jgi:hypothetical protein